MIFRLDGAVTLLLVPFLPLCCGGDPAVPTPAEGRQGSIAHVVNGDTVELADVRRVCCIGINTPKKRRRPTSASSKVSEPEGDIVYLRDTQGRLVDS